MYLLREETDVTEYRYTSEVEEKLLKTPLPLRKLGIGINYWYDIQSILCKDYISTVKNCGLEINYW